MAAGLLLILRCSSRWGRRVSQRAEPAPAPAALRNFPSREQAGKEKLLGSPSEPAQLRALVRLGSLGPSWGNS